MNAKQRRLTTAADFATAPNADEAIKSAPVPSAPQTVVRPSGTSGRPSAFKWRLMPEQIHQLNDLTLRLSRDLNVVRVERSTMLAALVEVAGREPAVYAALLDQLRTE